MTSETTKIMTATIIMMVGIARDFFLSNCTIIAITPIANKAIEPKPHTASNSKSVIMTLLLSLLFVVTRHSISI